MSSASENRSAAIPQEQVLDRETIRRWRTEAITTAASDRLWPNRTEALCNALLATMAEHDRYREALERIAALNGARDEGATYASHLRGAIETAHDALRGTA